MGNLTKLYPMLPHLEADIGDLYGAVRPYLDWKLLERDKRSREILICRPTADWERTRAKDLLILSGKVAEAWLEYRNAAPA